MNAMILEAFFTLAVLVLFVYVVIHWINRD